MGKQYGRGQEKISTTLSKAIEYVDTRKELAEFSGLGQSTISKIEKIESAATPEQKEFLSHSSSVTP